MPLTVDDFKRIANGKDVIVCEDVRNGYTLKRIYFGNGKITKFSCGDRRIIGGETWTDNGQLLTKTLRYKSPRAKFSRYETATKVTEKVQVTGRDVVKLKYRRNIPGDRSDLKKYEISSDPVGFCVIINNEFTKTPSERRWSEIDKTKLVNTWGRLGFEIKLIENKDSRETRDALKQIANDPELKKHSCFAMIILSHGHSDSMVTNDNNNIHLSEIFDAFNDEKCENLVGKPKIFGIDICREHYSIEYTTINDYWQKEVAKAINKLIDKPVYNDMVISYGTCSGRNAIVTHKGSWYVDSLCKALDKHGTRYEIADILRIVNHLVSRKVDKNVDWRQNTEFKFIGVSCPLYFPRSRRITVKPLE